MKCYLPLFLLFAAAVIVRAAPNDPGKAALEFLEKVRERKINLTPGADTALSGQTVEEKKRKIARQLDRMAQDLGSDPLEVGEIKLDENFAAVLVHKVGGFDPRRLQIFPVALVRQGAEWLAAPVPASFENTGVNHAIAVKKRLKNLEDWMLREQVIDLEQLREQSAGRMRKKIELSITAAELGNYKAAQVAERFLAACRNKDLSVVLGLMGGLAAILPEDWTARLLAVDQALTSKAPAAQPWRLLTAPEVIQVRVRDEGVKTQHEFSIACLDPVAKASGRPRVEILTLELSRSSNGLWQVDLPSRFLNPSEKQRDDPDAPSEMQLLDSFSTKWRELHPSKPQATAELARQTFTTALADSNMVPVLGLTQLPADLGNARFACTEAARIWWLLHSPTVVCQAIPLGFKSDETYAAAMFQFLSAREPDRLEVKTFYFEKSAAGWLWNAAPISAVLAPFQEWVRSETEQWQEKWQQVLLAESIQLQAVELSPAPTEDEARRSVTSWLDAIRRRDLASALKLVARLGDARSGAMVLKNLGYEISSSDQDTSPAEITGVEVGKIWTTVQVKKLQAGKPLFPLYVLIQTSQGPRILAEVDLFTAGNRGREFLNRAAIQRLEDRTTAESLAELRALYVRHQAVTVRPDR